MKKHYLIDNILLSSVWLFWAVTLVFFINDRHLYCLISGALSLLGLMLYFFNIRTRFFHMFGRKQTESESAPAVPAAMPLSAISHDDKKPFASADNSRRCTVIAKSTLFTGNIDVDGDIQVYGDVRGNVHVKEGTIRVMHAGRVEGELSAPEIIIDGTVEGTCEAKSIDILEHGILRGTRRSISFSIKRGGVFIGQSEQLKQEEEPTSVVAFKTPVDDDENLLGDEINDDVEYQVK
ncbi:cytoskeletal protein CcmA (bactofilin family) [Enterobacillus tribolii]|uniref:Cytoskeletal protein CcmA (Bactofilin family) n=2 Tax=Enterobacillus tribolii TaxID=1487935 RepID=A0A370R3S7_9GAMM|nr:cytoskeletal protein CcmA (bactofilin family) [Enterobacillus tribolii]